MPLHNPFFPLESMFSRPSMRTRWQPAADVYRMSNGWLVKVELAGVRKDEFSARIIGDQLVLRGRRRDWQILESGECQSLEITYDEFERSFQFPIDLTNATIDTEYAEGMLLIRIRGGQAE